MRRIFVMAILLLATNSLFSQIFTVAGQGVGYVYVGPKFGTNFSTITNSTQSGGELSTRTGFQVGAVGEFGLTNMISFETELTFNSKGFKENLTTTNGYSNTKVNYLSIPLLAKLSFKALGLSKVYAVGGTYNNLRVNAKQKWVYQDFEFEEEPYVVTEHYTILDWGLSIGGGAAYETKYGLLCLDLRYDLGVVDVDKSNVTERNMNRSVGVALAFKYDAVSLYGMLK